MNAEKEGPVTAVTLFRKYWSKIVLFALTPAIAAATGYLADNLWLGLFVALPILLLELTPQWCWIQHGEPAIATPWTIGVGVYLAVLIAVTWPTWLSFVSPLEGNRNVPRNWLGLERFGHWRYWIAPRTESTDLLAVLKINKPEAGTTFQEARLQIFRAAEWAREAGAKGVALDFTLSPPPPKMLEKNPAAANEISDANRTISYILKRWRENENPFPYVLGWRHRQSQNNKITIPDGGVVGHLKKQGINEIEDKNLGHIAAYEQSDGYVRAVPLYLKTRIHYPALSIRIAEHVGGLGKPSGATEAQSAEVDVNDILFMPPPDLETIPLIKWQEGQDSSELRGQFVLIGEDSDRDKHLTPWDDEPIPGVLIHAYAAEALIAGVRISRSPWWISVLAVLYPCLNLAARFSRRGWFRASKASLLASSVAVTLLVWAIAAAAMHFQLVWIPIHYTLFAMWGFFLLGLPWQNRNPRIPKVSPPPTTPISQSGLSAKS